MKTLLGVLAAWLWLGLLDDVAREERAFHEARVAPAEGVGDAGDAAA